MLINIGRKGFTALVFALAFVINPAYVTGCGSEEEEPLYGEAEMVALLEDFTAAPTTELEDGDAQYEIELSLVQSEGDDAVSSREGSAFASTAFACENRTFMKSAAACATMTTMVIEGSLTLRRVDGDEPVTIVEDLPVEGTMTGGYQLKYATINLEFEGGSAYWETSNGMDFALESLDARGLGDDALDISVP
jgi:hypothetical protein